MLSHRKLQPANAERIVQFPQSAEELFFMFPKADYPLAPERLLAEAKQRFHPTVVLCDGKVAGYGNFIHAEQGVYCTIGNLVVDPALRNKGIATYLIETLVGIAVAAYAVTYVKISCFNANTAGLLLYRKLGFLPVKLEMRTDHRGQKVALIHMHRQTTDAP